MWKRCALKKNRGRPLGFKLSDKSKRAISEAKKETVGDAS